jgi:hypothetical protein
MPAETKVFYLFSSRDTLLYSDAGFDVHLARNAVYPANVLVH